MGHFLHCEIFFCRSFRPWNLTNFARSLRAERGEVNQAWGESSLIEFQLFHWSPFHACHNLIHSLVLIKAQSFTIYKVCMFFLEHGFTINVLGWRSYPGITTEGTFKTEYISSWHMTFKVKTKVFPLFQTSKKDARGDKISPGHLSPRASFHPGICLTRASFHPGKWPPGNFVPGQNAPVKCLSIVFDTFPWHWICGINIAYRYFVDILWILIKKMWLRNNWNFFHVRLKS